MGLDYVGVGFSVAAVGATIVIGSLSTKIDNWYFSRSTSLTPPKVVFPIVWTTLFVLIGISMYRAYTKAPKYIYALYMANLVLNFTWSILFFGVHKPYYALVELFFLWASILAIILLVWPHDKAAGALMIPYIVWVSFASILNWQFARKDDEMQAETVALRGQPQSA